MTEVAKMYGGSLYELAAEEHRQEAILADFDQVNALFAENPEYLRLLSTPSIPKAERCELIDRAFRGNIDSYLLNFLKILCENGTLSQLSGCAREMRNRYNADNGIAEATAYSAAALTDAQKAALTAQLEKASGKKVELTCRVKPDVLGGIRLEMDGVQIDGTVEGRLAAIRKAIGSIML